MKVSREKLYNYLGITLDYSVKGQVKITIMYYINKILKCLNKAEPKTIITESSAALMNMSAVDEGCEKLIK